MFCPKSEYCTVILLCDVSGVTAWDPLAAGPPALAAPHRHTMVQYPGGTRILCDNGSFLANNIHEYTHNVGAMFYSLEDKIVALYRAQYHRL